MYIRQFKRRKNNNQTKTRFVLAPNWNNLNRLLNEVKLTYSGMLCSRTMNHQNNNIYREKSGRWLTTPSTEIWSLVHIL